jgi:ComF family protein
MALSQVLDFLLPHRCLLCRGLAPDNLCHGCDADLPAMVSACARCVIPLDGPGGFSSHRAALVCGECISKPPEYDFAIAALHYVFPVTVLVQRFKFNRSFACGQVLAARLLRALEWQAADEPPGVEALVPVPLHPSRRFLRVFNQAEVLARDLGRALSIPVAARVLRRTRRTPAQSGLSARDRQLNLRGAFAARPVEMRHVALVDDVMTTGATLSACAREIRRAGVETVSVWVAARAS